jgi:hypothetical protein
MVLETDYAKTADGVHIAHPGVFGEGRVDLVLASWALKIDTLWGGNRTPTRSRLGGGPEPEVPVGSRASHAPS